LLLAAAHKSYLEMSAAQKKRTWAQDINTLQKWEYLQTKKQLYKKWEAVQGDLAATTKTQRGLENPSSNVRGEWVNAAIERKRADAFSNIYTLAAVPDRNNNFHLSANVSNSPAETNNSFNLLPKEDQLPWESLNDRLHEELGHPGSILIPGRQTRSTAEYCRRMCEWSLDSADENGAPIIMMWITKIDNFLSISDDKLQEF
jgi:hypothetical protein